METMAQDYYQILGIGRTATPEEIHKAYRELARKYHPDLNPDDKAAQQKFKDVQKANEVLSDPEKRKLYDQLGPDFERMGPGGPGGGQPGGFGFDEVFGGGAGPGGFQFEGDLGDLFRQFGGGGAPGGSRRRTREQRPAKPVDLTADLTVPFNTAVLGGEAMISVRRQGQSESITVKIPPGVESGKKMRLRGQGEPSGNGAVGDLIVTLSVAEHPYFKRNGKNLEVKLPITIPEAVLGATVDVPTPGGTVSLKIPPGSSSGRRLRVRGQGVFNQSDAPGDLYVILSVMAPEGADELDEESLAALQRLQDSYKRDVRHGIIW